MVHSQQTMLSRNDTLRSFSYKYVAFPSFKKVVFTYELMFAFKLLQSFFQEVVFSRRLESFLEKICVVYNARCVLKIPVVFLSLGEIPSNRCCFPRRKFPNFNLQSCIKKKNDIVAGVYSVFFTVRLNIISTPHFFPRNPAALCLERNNSLKEMFSLTKRKLHIPKGFIP